MNSLVATIGTVSPLTTFATLVEVIPGATAAALLAGALLPLFGMWLVLQRVSFLGITLSQVAAAGVALGLLLGLPVLPLAFGMCAALAVFVTRGARGASGVSGAGDSTLGAAFCFASALALLFISRSPADLDEVGHVLHGNLIFAAPGDVTALAVTLLAGAAVVLAGFRRILFCSFDPETAAALGLRVRGWLLLLFFVLSVVLAFAMRTTGSLLTFALLVLPALSALALGRGLHASFVLASAFGCASALAGLALGVVADLHLESAIVVCAFALLVLAHVARRSWPSAVLLAALLAALAPLLAPEDRALPGERHIHEPGAAPAHAEPWHLDVHLSARRTEDPDVLDVEWVCIVHRDDPAVPLPPALWLVMLGDDGRALDEFAMSADTRELPPGKSTLKGRRAPAGAAQVSALDGQVWSGPLHASDSEPLLPVHLIGCELP